MTFEFRGSTRSGNYSSQFEARSGEAQNFELERSTFFQRNNGNNDNLSELFYDRNPGDARVKVGLERKVVSSPLGPTRAELRCRRDRGFSITILPAGASKIGPVIGEFTPKKISSDRWDSALKYLALLYKF